MALSTSSMLVVRGRPPGFAGGMSGSSMAHAASVKSLVYRFRFIPPVYPPHQAFQMASKFEVPSFVDVPYSTFKRGQEPFLEARPAPPGPWTQRCLVLDYP